ncbi:hypothetical protein HYV73_02275 [Candidatus Uhrbacteria bacterium]|nr:hypothetical protein [Candidatus Uhrbacteria bacterium]
MTNQSPTPYSLTINSMKNAFAPLMLASMVLGFPAYAQASPDEIQIGVFSTLPIVEAVEETPVAEQPTPTVQEVLLLVCEEKGYGEDCGKTLLGMLWNESSNRATVIGDRGAARGYFQIHYKLHKITAACAEDLVCSARWSLAYLERNQYPKYKNYAIQCHNSCNVKNGYAAKAVRHGNYFWDKPLAITQPAPIVLAVK